jgi:hypothetical protein
VGLGDDDTRRPASPISSHALVVITLKRSAWSVLPRGIEVGGTPACVAVGRHVLYLLSSLQKLDSPKWGTSGGRSTDGRGHGAETEGDRAVMVAVMDRAAAQEAVARWGQHVDPRALIAVPGNESLSGAFGLEGQRWGLAG